MCVCIFRRRFKTDLFQKCKSSKIISGGSNSQVIGTKTNTIGRDEFDLVVFQITANINMLDEMNVNSFKRSGLIHCKMVLFTVIMTKRFASNGLKLNDLICSSLFST